MTEPLRRHALRALRWVITVTEADPDAALYELIRYATVDAEDPSVTVPLLDGIGPRSGSDISGRARAIHR